MSFQSTFQALSNPVRRSILSLLKNGDMSATQIANNFELTNATISHHLSVLKKSDLVEERKVKNFIYYRVNTSVVDELLCYLNELRGIENEEN